ncbi:MAG: DUF1642 domain-containing protein [Streptococcus lutetiensis]|jgi:hypothetical protein
MNKQELIDKLKRRLGMPSEIDGSQFDKGFEWATKCDLALITKLDEPEKPVVPQFVADFYELIKDDFEDGVYDLFVEFYEDGSELNTELYWWFKLDVNKPIETLVKMKLFGYEVEKEKLYTVELPSPNCPTDDHYILSRLKNGKIIVNRYCIEQWEKFGDCQLTEAEIKQDFEWAWQFAKEVEE